MRTGTLIISVLLLSALCYASLIDSSTIENAIIDSIFKIINNSISFMIAAINFFLSYDPQIGDAFVPLHTKVLELLVPLYLLILTWNGIQIMTSDVVSTQANARITLQNTLLSMLLVASSLYTYGLLVDLSHAVSSYLVATPLEVPGLVSELTTIAFFLMLLSELILFLLFLLIRFIFISLGAVLFPFAIFLYFFSPTKRYGKSLISLIIFFLFVQVIVSLVFSVMSILITTPPKSTGSDLITEYIYRACIWIGALSILLLLIGMTLLQIVLTVVFPEAKLASFAITTAGSINNVGGQMVSE